MVWSAAEVRSLAPGLGPPSRYLARDGDIGEINPEWRHRGAMNARVAGRRSTGTLCLGSVFGGTLGAIDDEDIDLLLSRIEPQAELFPYSCEY